MKISALLSVVLFALSAGVLLVACGTRSNGARPGQTVQPALPPAGSAVVFGTVIDLASGEPAADVEVSAPGGKTTRSDAQGRFELRGLPVGAQGEVRARAADGREAVNSLLPLGHERREIVLQLGAR